VTVPDERAVGEVGDELLKESLLELYEDAPCGYLFTEPNGTILRVNRALLEWTGRARGELIGRRFQDLLTVPGRLFYENQYAPLLRMQGFINAVAFEILRVEREPLAVLVNSVLRTDGQGKPRHVASTVVDATARRAYERELLRARRAAEELAAIVEASDDAILSTSAGLEIHTWNAGAERLLGHAAGSAVGRHLSEMLPLVADASAWAPVEAELSAGRPVRLETEAVHAGGERIDVSAALTPHMGPLGELSGVSSILRDVRERKEAERLQQEFLAMASHELRNPLTAVKGHAQIMLKQGRFDARAMETVVAQANQLDRLVDDLLLASQVAANRLPLRLAAIDLVGEARGASAAHARPNGPPLRVEAEEERVMVMADARRLRQVLANLIGNAIKYSPGGGEVVVGVSQGESEASISVRDQGVGIPAEALPRLFDRFYRVSATAGQAQGLGLGLYITHQLVRAHGGRITVESEVGRGSTFTVTLPLA
jgi:PAS domain S-box-containing protein